jgi:hypothetical protein
LSQSQEPSKKELKRLLKPVPQRIILKRQHQSATATSPDIKNVSQDAVLRTKSLNQAMYSAQPATPQWDGLKKSQNQEKTIQRLNHAYPAAEPKANISATTNSIATNNWQERTVDIAQEKNISPISESITAEERIKQQAIINSTNGYSQSQTGLTLDNGTSAANSSDIVFDNKQLTQAVLDLNTKLDSATHAQGVVDTAKPIQSGPLGIMQMIMDLANNYAPVVQKIFSGTGNEATAQMLEDIKNQLLYQKLGLLNPASPAKVQIS